MAGHRLGVRFAVVSCALIAAIVFADGAVDGKRILPPGWVAYSTKPTLGSDYGSGFCANGQG
jgi:hypothetical protein